MKDLEGIPDRTRVAAWRPIESAPKDGTVFLAYQPAGEANPEIFPALIGAGYFTTWDTFTLDGVGGYEVEIELDHPTHWMPLPDAPEEPSPLLTAEEGPGCKPPTSS